MVKNREELAQKKSRKFNNLLLRKSFLYYTVLSCVQMDGKSDVYCPRHIRSLSSLARFGNLQVALSSWELSLQSLVTLLGDSGTRLKSKCKGLSTSLATSWLYNFGQIFNSPYLSFVIYKIGTTIVPTSQDYCKELHAWYLGCVRKMLINIITSLIQYVRHK